MARTPSQMVDLGTEAPDFRLEDMLSGKTVSRDDFRDKNGLLVMFLCNHCPFVKHVADKLAEVTRDAQSRGLGVVAIMSNDLDEYPEDGPEATREEAKRRGFEFPYLLDGTQKVAQAYRAACTPDFFLYDADLKLAYRGQLDDSRPGNGKPVTGEDLQAAIDRVLARQSPLEEQKPSLGCNIKWKPGNAPDYFG